MTRDQSIKELMQIPGAGKSIAHDLLNIGVNKMVGELEGSSEIITTANKIPLSQK